MRCVRRERSRVALGRGGNDEVLLLGTLFLQSILFQQLNATLANRLPVGRPNDTRRPYGLDSAWVIIGSVVCALIHPQYSPR